MSTNVDWAEMSSEDEGDKPHTSKQDHQQKKAESTSASRSVQKVENPAFEKRSKQYPNRPDHIQNPQPPREGPSSFFIMVSNLKYSATIDDIGNYFADGGCHVKDVILPGEEYNGVAFVYFEDKESQDNALNADGTEMLGRKIRVRILNANRGYKKVYSNTTNASERSDRPRDVQRSNSRDDRTDSKEPRNDRYRKAPKNEVSADSSDIWSRKPNSSIDEKTPAEIPKTQSKPVTTERPSLKLQPRTAPVEEIGKFVAPSSIFGEGKPRDEFIIEVYCTIVESFTKQSFIQF